MHVLAMHDKGTFPKNHKYKLSMVVHAYNPSLWKMESFRLSWATLIWINLNYMGYINLDQPQLYRKILSQKNSKISKT